MVLEGLIRWGKRNAEDHGKGNDDPFNLGDRYMSHMRGDEKFDNLPALIAARTQFDTGETDEEDRRNHRFHFLTDHDGNEATSREHTIVGLFRDAIKSSAVQNSGKRYQGKYPDEDEYVETVSQLVNTRLAAIREADIDGLVDRFLPDMWRAAEHFKERYSICKDEEMAINPDYVMSEAPSEEEIKSTFGGTKISEEIPRVKRVLKEKGDIKRYRERFRLALDHVESREMAEQMAASPLVYAEVDGQLVHYSEFALFRMRLFLANRWGEAMDTNGQVLVGPDGGEVTSLSEYVHEYAEYEQKHNLGLELISREEFIQWQRRYQLALRLGLEDKEARLRAKDTYNYHVYQGELQHRDQVQKLILAGALGVAENLALPSEQLSEQDEVLSAPILESEADGERPASDSQQAETLAAAPAVAEPVIADTVTLTPTQNPNLKPTEEQAQPAVVEQSFKFPTTAEVRASVLKQMGEANMLLPESLPHPDLDEEINTFLDEYIRLSHQANHLKMALGVFNSCSVQRRGFSKVVVSVDEIKFGEAMNVFRDISKQSNPDTTDSDLRRLREWAKLKVDRNQTTEIPAVALQNFRDWATEEFKQRKGQLNRLVKEFAETVKESLFTQFKQLYLEDKGVLVPEMINGQLTGEVNVIRTDASQNNRRDALMNIALLLGLEVKRVRSELLNTVRQRRDNIAENPRAKEVDYSELNSISIELITEGLLGKLTPVLLEKVFPRSGS